MQFSILIIYNASQPLQQVQIVKSVLRLGRGPPMAMAQPQAQALAHWHTVLVALANPIRSLAPMHCHALLTSRKFTLQLPESKL